MCLFPDIVVGTAGGAIGANSTKDSNCFTNEIKNKLPSSQPLSIATTTDLAGSTMSTNAPLPIIDEKCNVLNPTNQVTVSSTTFTSSTTVTTNSVLEATNVNVGKLFV